MRLCLAVVLLVTLALLTACGGEDSERLTEGEYFSELSDIDARLRPKFRFDPLPVVPEISAPPTTPPREYGWDEVVEDVNNLRPPESVEAEHAAFLASVRNYRDGLPKFEAVIESEAENWSDESAAANDASKELLESCGELLRHSEGDLRLSRLCVDESCSEVAEGVEACLRESPPIPDGFTAVSAYLELHAEENLFVQIGLPLHERAPPFAKYAFYSFEDGNWIHVADAAVELSGDLAQSHFEGVPENLIVLRED